MKNFVFRNLTHDKDLVSDLPSYSLFKNFYFSKIDKNTFL